MPVKITRESCRAAGACWSDERLSIVIPPEGLTPAEVAAREEVPLHERVWALIYASGMTAAGQRLFACRCARRALARVADPDPRSLVAVEVAERYSRGVASENDMRVAAASADVAAAAADDAPAAYAAESATITTDPSSSYAAYAAAAYGAKSVAAYAAEIAYAADSAATATDAYAVARDDERRAQLDDLVAILEAY